MWQGVTLFTLDWVVREGVWVFVDTFKLKKEPGAWRSGSGSGRTFWVERTMSLKAPRKEQTCLLQRADEKQKCLESSRWWEEWGPEEEEERDVKQTLTRSVWIEEAEFGKNDDLVPYCFRIAAHYIYLFTCRWIE